MENAQGLEHTALQVEEYLALVVPAFERPAYRRGSELRNPRCSEAIEAFLNQCNITLFSCQNRSYRHFLKEHDSCFETALKITLSTALHAAGLAGAPGGGQQRGALLPPARHHVLHGPAEPLSACEGPASESATATATSDGKPSYSVRCILTRDLRNGFTFPA